MEKFVEKYREILSSPTEVPIHYQVKHSIDLTLGTPLPDVAIPHATTQTESTHVLSQADKATKFIEHSQHVRQQV